MKQPFLLFLFLLTLSTLSAQNIISYAYDNAGNRISRKVVNLAVTPNPTHVKAQNPAPVEDILGERVIKVYPNPTKGALAVEITGGNDKDQMHIILYNIDGKQLLNKQVQTDITPVNMTAYPAAFYILRVQAGEKATEFKIIKQ